MASTLTESSYAHLHPSILGNLLNLKPPVPSQQPSTIKTPLSVLLKFLECCNIVLSLAFCHFLFILCFHLFPLPLVHCQLGHCSILWTPPGDSTYSLSMMSTSCGPSLVSSSCFVYSFFSILFFCLLLFHSYLLPSSSSFSFCCWIGLLVLSILEFLMEHPL